MQNISAAHVYSLVISAFLPGLRSLTLMGNAGDPDDGDDDLPGFENIYLDLFRHLPQLRSLKLLDLGEPFEADDFDRFSLKRDAPSIESLSLSDADLAECFMRDGNADHLKSFTLDVMDLERARVPRNVVELSLANTVTEETQNLAPFIHSLAVTATGPPLPNLRRLVLDFDMNRADDHYLVSEYLAHHIFALFAAVQPSPLETIDIRRFELPGAAPAGLELPSVVKLRLQSEQCLDDLNIVGGLLSFLTLFPSLKELHLAGFLLRVPRHRSDPLYSPTPDLFATAPSEWSVKFPGLLLLLESFRRTPLLHLRYNAQSPFPRQAAFPEMRWTRRSASEDFEVEVWRDVRDVM
ncbi:hypothetical protein JCM10450v2_004924 [Rhodotorula kratochvilovae]